MPLLRAIFLITALLAQALPVSVSAQEETKMVCGMPCCAVAAACCCAEPSPEPSLPAPASVPPMTGRQLVPAAVWTEFVPLAVFEVRELEPKVLYHEHDVSTLSQVRLPVLFCSFVI